MLKIIWDICILMVWGFHRIKVLPICRANLAASQGNKRAKENLDVVAEDMTPEQITEAKAMGGKMPRAGL